MSLKFYSIAAVFGELPDNKLVMTVTGTWLAPSPEVGAAQFVSKFYFDGGPRHALIGLAIQEITPDAIRQAMNAVEQPEPQKIVPLGIVASDPPEGA